MQKRLVIGNVALF